MILLQCDVCGKKLQADPKWAGKQVRCTCSRVLRVPIPVSSGPSEEAPLLLEIVPETETPPIPIAVRSEGRRYRRQDPPAQKSLVVAYLLWAVFGLFGGHRFYLGRWFTGLIYALSFGIYGIGWLVDLFFLPILVGKFNRSREEQADTFERLQQFTPSRKAPGVEPAPRFEAIVEDEDELPAWARQSGLLAPLDFPLRLAFFVVAPCLFIITALMLQHWPLLILVVVSLVLVGFVGRIDRTLQEYPMLRQIPGLDRPLNYLQTFTDFYQVNRPFPFLCYVFYPITCPLLLMVSPRARSEFGMFARLVGGLVFLILAPMGLSYFELFPPHLGFSEAFSFYFAHAFFIVGMVVVFVIPVLTTAFTLNARRATFQLRSLVVVGFLSALPFGLVYWLTFQSAVTFNATQFLQDRFSKDSFRAEVHDVATMFLDFWSKKPVEGDEKISPAPGISPQLTERIQKQFGGMVPGRESKAFHILRWREEGPEPGVWMALGLSEFSKSYSARLLAVCDSQGKIYWDWNGLPEPIRRRFEQTRFIEKARTGYPIAEPALLNDWQARGKPQTPVGRIAALQP